MFTLNCEESAMKKANSSSGFSLAELLVAVAIIAVLVAVSIPLFTNQLEKSREATDAADARVYYAEIVASLVSETLNKDNTIIHVGNNLEATATYEGDVLKSVTVSGWEAHQKVAKWQIDDLTIAKAQVPKDSNWVGATSITYVFENDTLESITAA